MSTYEIIRAVVWIAGIPVIVFLFWSITRRVRAIRELDKQLRDDEARQVSNPYAEMAQMYEAQEVLNKTKRK